MSPLIRRSTNARPAAVSNTFSMLRIEMSGPVTRGEMASLGATLEALEKKGIVTPKLTRGHSARRASRGLIRVARRVGAQRATIATTANNADTAAKTGRSIVLAQ